MTGLIIRDGDHIKEKRYESKFFIKIQAQKILDKKMHIPQT
jgi:hypothetical protein